MSKNSISIESLNENLVQMIHNKWAVLTVQDENKVNGMIVNWIQVGWLWNKHVVTVYVRPQRHTYPLINKETTFSLAFFDDEHKANLAYLGKASGKDEDKLAQCKYTTSSVHDTPVIDQAKLVFICKKIYVTDLNEESFLDDNIINNAYPNNDFHRCFTAEILDVIISE